MHVEARNSAGRLSHLTDVPGSMEASVVSYYAVFVILLYGDHNWNLIWESSAFFFAYITRIRKLFLNFWGFQILSQTQ